MMPKQRESVITISITMERELHERWNRTIPWGMRSQIINNLMEAAMDAIDQDEGGSWGKIVDGEFSLELHRHT